MIIQPELTLMEAIMERSVLVCDFCGQVTVEETAEGPFCTKCNRPAKKEKRAVHHEGFPHVVSEDEES